MGFVMARPARSPSKPAGDAVGRRRLSRADWVEMATEVLASEGLPAVAVEPISERLGVTKGSFYAHFANRDELVGAVLERWKAVDTDQVLGCLDQIDDPRERLARFLEFGFERRHWGRVFAALCATSSDPKVEAFMQQVRNGHLDYLERALRQLGLPRSDAHDRATLIYSTYVGFWRLVVADSNWEYNDADSLHRIAEQIKCTLIPSPDKRPEMPIPIALKSAGDRPRTAASQRPSRPPRRFT